MEPNEKKVSSKGDYWKSRNLRDKNRAEINKPKPTEGTPGTPIKPIPIPWGQAFKKKVAEGLVKTANKAKKNALDVKVGGSKASPIQGPDSDLVRGRNLRQGVNSGQTDTSDRRAIMHKQIRGVKKVPQIYDKESESTVPDSKSYTLRKLEAIVIERFNSRFISEGKDDTDTDHDSISNAGGDSGAYAKLKARKDAKASAGPERQAAAKTMYDTADKLGVEPSNTAGNITRGSFRRNVLGSSKAGKGNPFKDNANKPAKPASPVRQHAPTPPLSTAQINKSGVGGKPGEAATQAKYAKIDKVPSANPKGDARKALVKKAIAMRSKPSL